ncbi:MAG TPA: hypothetical protein VNO52_12270 [Methylomirabilota bacterium]|nr:hypothetical protein [Methylomirabilota bacterium]
MGIERQSNQLHLRESLPLNLGVAVTATLPSRPCRLTFDWEIASLLIDPDQPAEFAVMEVWLASADYDLPDYLRDLLDLSGCRLLFARSGVAPGQVQSGSAEIPLYAAVASPVRIVFGLYVGNEDYHDAVATFRNVELSPVPEPTNTALLMLAGLAAVLSLRLHQPHAGRGDAPNRYGAPAKRP